MTDVISESQVSAMWQNQVPGRTDLVTEEGEPVRIVYAGRINDDRGADFLDAVVATNRGILRGDVEVHVRSGSWWAHRHHLDPAYNRVILHVVLWHDSGTAINLQNGQKVPTLALHRLVEAGSGCDRGAGRTLPCRRFKSARNMDVIGGLMDQAGEERFLSKASDFQVSLARMEASQCLYQGIMGALGYAKNRLPMLELSRRVPLQVLDSAAPGIKSETEGLVRLQAMLLGTAGMLPSQSANCRSMMGQDDWVARLEAAWVSLRHGETMSADDWNFFKVRPWNFPPRRLAAMSYLLRRYREKGLLEALIDGELRDAGSDRGCHELEEALIVAADGYWASYLDIDLPVRTNAPALLGKARAADIVVNVILPFTAALGRTASRPGLTARAIELYHRYPRPATNAIEKHMIHQLGIGRQVVDSARRQQGLLHIYKTLCAHGRCHDCPLGGERALTTATATAVR